jgi:hypothetical protein
VKRWPALLPLLFALVPQKTDAQSAPVFNAPAFTAFAPVPAAWRSQSGASVGTTGYGVMYNISLVSRELMFPLMSQSMASSYFNWQVSLDVGGTVLSTLNPIACTLYVVAQGEILASSGAQYYSSPSTGVLTLTVSHTPCATAFVDCSVPAQAWVGNAIWTSTPTP